MEVCWSGERDKWERKGDGAGRHRDATRGFEELKTRRGGARVCGTPSRSNAWNSIIRMNRQGRADADAASCAAGLFRCMMRSRMGVEDVLRCGCGGMEAVVPRIVKQGMTSVKRVASDAHEDLTSDGPRNSLSVEPGEWMEADHLQTGLRGIGAAKAGTRA